MHCRAKLLIVESNRIHVSEIGYRSVQNANFGLQTVDCRLQTGGKMQTEGEIKH